MDADTAENGTDSRNCVVTHLYCTVPRKPGDPPVLHDLYPIRLVPGTRLHSIYGVDTIQASHFCNYGLNPEYVSRFTDSGMRVAGFADSGDIRAVELPEHRFSVAPLFHPQLESRPGHASPFVCAFIEAARGLSAAI